MGRPRMRRLEEVGKELWERKVQRCRKKAMDREEWVFVIKEGTACRGP
jgi:hypothetical protein